MESHKYRRFAPKDFTWQECVTLKSKLKTNNLLTRLSADEWIDFPSKEERVKEREEKEELREKKKALRKSKKPIKLDYMTIDVPEGAKKLTLQLLTRFE